MRKPKEVKGTQGHLKSNPEFIFLHSINLRNSRRDTNSCLKILKEATFQEQSSYTLSPETLFSLADTFTRNETYRNNHGANKCNDFTQAYPHRNYHIPYQGTFEDDFPFPKVGYVCFREGI